jgi:hypothetical protein
MCCSAMSATIWCPLHPHPHAEGTAARTAKPISSARANRGVRVITIQAGIWEDEFQTILEVRKVEGTTEKREDARPANRYVLGEIFFIKAAAIWFS